MKMFRAIAALAVLCGVLACGGDSTAPNPMSGTYTLQTVDGIELPVIISIGGDDVVFHSASVTLKSDNTYSQTAVVEVASGTTTISDSGVIKKSGGSLTFVSTEGALTTTGSWSGNTLTISDGGYLWIYTK